MVFRKLNGDDAGVKCCEVTLKLFAFDLLHTISILKRREPEKRKFDVKNRIYWVRVFFHFTARKPYLFSSGISKTCLWRQIVFLFVGITIFCDIKAKLFFKRFFLEKHSYIRFRFTSCYLNMHIWFDSRG